MTRQRRKSAKAQATEEGILELKRQGMTRAQIVQAGFPRSTVYAVWPVDPKHITIPADPRDEYDRSVTVAMSHSEFARLGTQPKVVAGMFIAEKEAADSLRKRILAALAQEGYPDVLTLMAAIRRPGDPRDNWGAHEVTHIIKSLNKQGLATYVETRQGTVVIPNRIRITDAGAREAGVGPMPKQIESPSVTRQGSRRHPPGYSRSRHAPGKDMTEQRHHRSIATGGEVMRISAAEQVPMSRPLDTGSGALERPVQPEAGQSLPLRPDPDRYPMLDALLQRFEANAEADAKAAKYAEAAAALEDIDPERSEQLLALAEEVGGRPFTALEIEVARFLSDPDA